MCPFELGNLSPFQVSRFDFGRLRKTYFVSRRL
jgi:hypothetical protein